jgi:phage/plasmid-like protein (TIGR03299 family)
MSDNIFGERFMSVRQPAWHGLGTVIQKAVKPSLAVKKFHLDYEVGTYPMVAIVGKKQVKTDKVAIMRSPTAEDKQWRLFGTAGGKYEIVQNKDLANIMDTIHEVWGLETMGAIDLGKTIFMTFKTGDQDIEGDQIKGYFLVTDTKDGGTSVKCAYTPVRVVCSNTLRSGLKQATIAINIQHITGAKDQLAARVNLIAKAQKAIDETTMVFRQLANAKVTTKQAELMFDQVYPLPKTPEDMALVDYSQEDLGALLFKGVQDSMYAYNFYTKQAQDLRAGASELYEKLNDEYPNLAGSAWHVWNAIVESADFRDGGRSPEISSLFGARAREKATAFKLATQFIKK